MLNLLLRSTTKSNRSPCTLRNGGISYEGGGQWRPNLDSQPCICVQTRFLPKNGVFWAIAKLSACLLNCDRCSKNRYCSETVGLCRGRLSAAVSGSEPPEIRPLWNLLTTETDRTQRAGKSGRASSLVGTTSRFPSGRPAWRTPPAVQPAALGSDFLRVARPSGL